MFEVIEDIKLRKKAIIYYIKQSIYINITIFLIFIVSIFLTCLLFYITLNSNSESFQFICLCFSIMLLIFSFSSGIIFILDLGISTPEIYRLLKYKKELKDDKIYKYKQKN